MLSGENATVRSDLYSIGVLLYRLLTRLYPVRATGLADLRWAHALRERTDVRSARQDVPSRLAGVIERAIDPEPERRYESADALAADLERIDVRHRFVQMAYAAGVVLPLMLIVWGGWQLPAAGTPAARQRHAVRTVARPPRQSAAHPAPQWRNVPRDKALQCLPVSLAHAFDQVER